MRTWNTLLRRCAYTVHENALNVDLWDVNVGAWDTSVVAKLTTVVCSVRSYRAVLLLLRDCARARSVQLYTYSVQCRAVTQPPTDWRAPEYAAGGHGGATTACCLRGMDGDRTHVFFVSSRLSLSLLLLLLLNASFSLLVIIVVMHWCYSLQTAAGELTVLCRSRSPEFGNWFTLSHRCLINHNNNNTISSVRRS